MEENFNLWWLIVGLLSFPLAWWARYLSSIRSEHWKRHIGYVMSVGSVSCLFLANIVSPEMPTGFELASLIIWLSMYASLAVIFMIGWDRRRSQSLFQERILQ